MPKVYIAAAFRRFSVRDELTKAYGEVVDSDYVNLLESIEEVFLNFGFDTCLPHRDEGLWGKVYYEPAPISSLCFRHVETSDVIFALAEGGRGVHIELGLAMGLGKRLIMMHQHESEPSTLIYGIPKNMSPWKGSEDDDVIIPYLNSDDLLVKLSGFLASHYSREEKVVNPSPRTNKAIIDLGSHTVKLKVFSYRRGSHPKALLNTKQSLGIMGDVLKTNELSVATIDAVISLLKDWQLDCLKLSCDSIIVTGTAALRKANNAHTLVAELKKETGLDLEILSPERELEYVYSGVLATFKSGISLAVLNLGGGSTQIGVGDRLAPSETFFLDFGTRELTEKWPWERPMSQTDYRALLDYVRERMRGTIPSVSTAVQRMVHTGGELDFMLRCQLPLRVSHYSPVHVSEISSEDFSSFSEQFSGRDPRDVAKVFGLDPAWAAGAVASNVIALCAAELLGAESIIPSNCNISDGLLLAR